MPNEKIEYQNYHLLNTYHFWISYFSLLKNCPSTDRNIYIYIFIYIYIYIFNLHLKKLTDQIQIWWIQVYSVLSSEFTDYTSTQKNVLIFISISDLVVSKTSLITFDVWQILVTTGPLESHWMTDRSYLGTRVSSWSNMNDIKKSWDLENRDDGLQLRPFTSHEYKNETNVYSRRH